MASAIGIGSEAPEFTLPGASDGSVSLKRGAGEYTLLNFWKST